MNAHLTAVVLSLGLLGAPAVAATRCVDLPVTVTAPTQAEAARACATAARVFRFLADHGLATRGLLNVHLSPELPPTCWPGSVGCYVHAERRIHFLTREPCERRDLQGMRPMTAAEFCRIALAHEFAHAVADANFRGGPRTLLAHEYIAYVTMLAVMSDGLRQRVLTAIDGDGFEGPEQMSIDYYLLDPLRFGVEAYRHFQKPGNGPAFFDDLLTGRVRLP